MPTLEALERGPRGRKKDELGVDLSGGRGLWGRVEGFLQRRKLTGRPAMGQFSSESQTAGLQLAPELGETLCEDPLDGDVGARFTLTLYLTPLFTAPLLPPVRWLSAERAKHLCNWPQPSRRPSVSARLPRFRRDNLLLSCTVSQRPGYTSQPGFHPAWSLLPHHQSACKRADLRLGTSPRVPVHATASPANSPRPHRLHQGSRCRRIPQPPQARSDRTPSKTFPPAPPNPSQTARSNLTPTDSPSRRHITSFSGT